jgi:hypothetical protein
MLVERSPPHEQLHRTASCPSPFRAAPAFVAVDRDATAADARAADPGEPVRRSGSGKKPLCFLSCIARRPVGDCRCEITRGGYATSMSEPQPPVTVIEVERVTNERRTTAGVAHDVHVILSGPLRVDQAV